MRLKNKIFRLSLIITSLVYFTNVYAQIGLAVAKNINGSSTTYALETGTDINDALSNAAKVLETQNEKNIFKLKSSEKTGHELKEGFYVLIFVSRKISGKFFLSYGLGASKASREEATKRALIHLKEFDWGFEDDFGYKMLKEGKVEDLFITEEE